MLVKTVCNRRGFTLIEWIVVFVVDIILLGVLLPGIFNVREAANRAKTQNNLKQIGLAMNNFDGAYMLLPHNQGITSGSNRRPALFHLLPYMENEAYYNAYSTSTAYSPATINYFMEPARSGPGYLTTSGATTDYATNGLIFGDITTTSSNSLFFNAGNPSSVTIPARHPSVTNCTTYSISKLSLSTRGTSNIIFAGQKRLSTGNYATRSTDLGILTTASSTTISSGADGRGTPHAISGYYVSKDPSGTTPFYGDWGSPYSRGTVFLFGDGHTATVRYSISGTSPFADAMNPNSTSNSYLE